MLYFLGKVVLLFIVFVGFDMEDDMLLNLFLLFRFCERVRFFVC